MIAPSGEMRTEERHSSAQGKQKVQASTLVNPAANTADSARDVAAAAAAAMAAKERAVAAKAAKSAAATAAREATWAARAALRRMQLLGPRPHCRRIGSSNGGWRRNRQARSVSKQRAP